MRNNFHKYERNFETMQHRGELVQKAIKESGYSVTSLAKKLRHSRRWMYHVFENPNLPLELIAEIGRIIHYDFSDEIKELRKYSVAPETNLVKESRASYGDYQKEAENWKNKYLRLLEKYNNLLASQATPEKKRKK